MYQIKIHDSFMARLDESNGYNIADGLTETDNQTVEQISRGVLNVDRIVWAGHLKLGRCL